MGERVWPRADAGRGQRPATSREVPVFTDRKPPGCGLSVGDAAASCGGARASINARVHGSRSKARLKPPWRVRDLDVPWVRWSRRVKPVRTASSALGWRGEDEDDPTPGLLLLGAAAASSLSVVRVGACGTSIAGDAPHRTGVNLRTPRRWEARGVGGCCCAVRVARRSRQQVQARAAEPGRGDGVGCAEGVAQS